MSYRILTAGDLRAQSAAADFTKLFRSDSERFWINLVAKDHAPTLVSESHDTEADIYVVTDGEADLYLGGTLVNPDSPSPGQHVGTGLDGADRRHIAAGDVVIIPEGVPHMLDARHSRVVYLVIKEEVVK